MTVCLYADVTPLSDRTIYTAHFEALPDLRKEKINRLKHDKARKLSLGAWIVLKKALEQYGCKADDAGFAYSKAGKPYLAGCPELHISISHSESIAMCAVSEYEVGADVEYISKFKEGVCHRFFTKNECEYIFLPASKELQTDRFFRMWTLKESYSKLTGKGIGDFRKFEIDPLGARPIVHHESKIRSAFFYEQDIPLYKAAICLGKEDKLHFERMNIITELLN